MNAIRGSLHRRLPQAAMNGEEMRSAAREAWTRVLPEGGRRVVILFLDDIRDPWTRQAIQNEATRQYGPQGT
jgi:hypothetical protein